MPIKPFIPSEIIIEFCKILQKNKKANNKLTILSNNLVFIAPELMASRFWYGSNNCMGFSAILNKYCSNTTTTDKEIQKENNKIKKLYKNIIKYYNENGFDEK